MIQTIREARVGTKFVCEIPAGWNAIFFRGRLLMVHPASTPVVLERDPDEVWRQKEIQIAAPAPQR